MGMLKELKIKDYATLLGTFCGVMAIFSALFFKAYRGAILFIFLGIIADFLDGYLARKLNQVNEIGKELDSLSDSLSFGVAPAVVAFANYTEPYTACGLQGWGFWIMAIPAFIFISAAIIRLAYFNVSSDSGYVGLPTPLSAGFLALTISIDYFAFLVKGTSSWFNVFIQWIMPFLLILLGWLNISFKVRYGKAIRKKTGKLKIIMATIAIAVFIVTGLAIWNREEAAMYITFLIAILWGIAFVFIMYGFFNKEES